MSQKFLSDVTLSTVTAGSMLKLDANGKIVAAVDGTDYISTSASSLWSTASGGIFYSDDVRVGTYQSDVAPDAKLHVYDYQTTTPKLLIEDGNTGDASMQFKISTQSFTMGIDNSDSDKFVIAASGGLGTSNVLEIATSGLSAFQNSVLVKGSLFINNQEQIQQGATEKIASFQNLGTERGYFEVTDTAKGYFVADGFKTATASTGFLKADGSVDTGSFFSGNYSDLSGTPTLGTMAAANTNDYKTSDEVETYVAGELVYTNISGTPTLGTAAAADTTDFATAAQGALADSALQSLPSHNHDGRYYTKSESDGKYAVSGDNFAPILADGFYQQTTEGVVLATSNTYRGLAFPNGGKNFVFEVSIKGNASANHQGIFWGLNTLESIYNNNETGYKLTHQGEQQLHIRDIATNTTQLTYQAPFAPNDTQWHRYKLIQYYNASENRFVFKVYIDGIEAFNVPQGQFNAPPQEPTYFGFINYTGDVEFSNWNVREITGEEDLLIAMGEGIFQPAGTYLTSLPAHHHDARYYTETEMDDFFDGTTAKTGYNKSDWDTAYGWGNHASEGYITSIPQPTSGNWWNNGYLRVLTDGVTELGRILDFHDSNTETSDYSYRMTASNTNMAFSGTITATGYNDSNWNTAYSWGNHANAGYVTASHTQSAESITGGILGGNGQIALANHPEGGRMLTPSFENDLAFIGQRGGAVAVYKTDSTDYTAVDLAVLENVNFNRDIPFNGKTNYSYATLGSVEDVVVWDIEMPFSLSYGNTWYVDFGAGAWQARTVKFLAYQSNDNAETNYKYVGGQFNDVYSGLKYTYGSYSNIRASNGTTNYSYNRLRVVMTDWNVTTPRIAAIGAKYYNSVSLAETLLSKGGGSVYGSISATGDITANNLNVSNWDTAYGWGNHASAGYLTSVPSEYLTQAEGDARYLQSLPAHNHDTLYDTLGSADAVAQQVNERIDTEVFDAIATVDGNIPTNNNQLTNGAGYATTSYVNTAVSNLVDTAPATLNTLNELAAALGDDPNFATTVTNSIAGKLSTSGGTLTGSLTLDGGSNLNLSTSGTDVGDIVWNDLNGELHRLWDGGANHLNYRYKGGTSYKVWTAYDFSASSFDAAGSAAAVATTLNERIDTEVFDAISAAQSTADGAVAKGVGYMWTATGSNALSFRSQNTIESSAGDQAALEVFQDNAGEDAFMQFHVSSDYAVYFGLDGSTNDLAVGGWSMGANKYKIWHAGNDGSGSGLDADTVDGLHESTFMRRSANSNLAMNNYNITGVNHITINDSGFGEGIGWQNWLISDCPDDLSNAAGNLQISSTADPSIRVTVDPNGNLYPSRDRLHALGLETNRWQIVFCEILDSAGQHEKNLQNPEGEKSVGEYETGTVLVWKGGKNVPCTTAADHMRMGIAVKGIDSPLIQGAEPVLVTGAVNEGDYLVTSTKEGHAEAISPEFMRQHGLYDCVLGKALESAEGESHLVKTWINI